MSKTLLEERVRLIAGEFGLEKTTVHEILVKYVEYLRYRMGSGYDVVLPGVLTLKVSGGADSEGFSRTFAFDCYELADMIKQSGNVVYWVCKSYVEGIRKDILEGKGALIYGVVTMKVERNTLVVLTSEKLKTDLAECGLGVRVHTAKALRKAVKEGIT